MNIEKTLKLAIEHHQAGRWLEAHRIYKQVLDANPDQPDALRLMGQVTFMTGNPTVAEGLVRRAIFFRPNAVDFHIDLARICQAQGNFAGAVDSFTRATQIDPFQRPEWLLELARALSGMGRFEEALVPARSVAEKKPTADSIGFLGEILLALNHVPEAVDKLRAAVSLAPDRADLRGPYAVALQVQGDFDLAEAEFRKTIAMVPGSPELLDRLGYLLIQRKKIPDAIVELKKAIALRPEFAPAHYNLALAFTGLGDTNSALASYRAALELQPNYAQAWEGLGRVLLDLKQYAGAATALGRLVALAPTPAGYRLLAFAFGGLDDLDSAIKAARTAVDLAPHSSEAHEWLGNELRWTGQLDAAIAEFRHALELDPANHSAHSNLVYTLLALDLTPKDILAEHIQWGRQQTATITPLRPPRNNPAPDRRLRIAYVSNNFRDQAVSSFVLPIIRHHDRIAFEVCCYSDLEIPDAVTGQYQQLADLWRESAAMTDEQLARQIREDRIDILIELTGHISKGRLRSLAFRPAPVQISYIGYQGTTGVSAVNYVLSDDWADPPGAEANYVEKPWRVPGSFFVYQPPGGAPMVGPLPVKSAGFITFGCLNAVWKATARSVKLWARVLDEVPGSKMMLLTTRCQETNQRLLAGFARGGIASDRVQLVQRSTAAQYLRHYGQIDIALDPVPFNGHTTTCDAAWMGCPTVTLSGQIYAHRYGGSVLRNIGLAELVTESEAAYVATAVGLANDLDRLTKLRASLRFTMQDSLITDAKKFTGNLEQAYRKMWRAWCAAPVE